MLTALLIVAVIGLPILHLNDQRRARARRGALFADCLRLFGAYRVSQSGTDFPILEGTYRKLQVRLEPVLDDLGVRKLPSLWLKATLLLANQDRGVVDFLVRPQGNEVYSPSSGLHHRHAIPERWPQHAILCTDDPRNLPDLNALTRHISAFDDARMKELLVTPRGVRLVYQAAQAERAEYLVLRQSRFERDRLDSALVKGLLDRVIAIASDLDASAAQVETIAA